MFNFFHTDKRALLLLDLYKSHISLTYVKQKSASEPRYYTVSSPLAYLRVSTPNHSLFKQAFEELVQDLLTKLAKKLGKDRQDFKFYDIFVFPHGNLSTLQSNEIYIKLSKAHKLDKNLISEILNKHHFDKNAFKKLIDKNPKNNIRYFKSKKVITQISPNYYNISSWQDKRTDKLSILLSQTLLEENLHITLSEKLKELFPSKKLHFISPYFVYASFLGNLNLHSVKNDTVDDEAFKEKEQKPTKNVRKQEKTKKAVEQKKQDLELKLQNDIYYEKGNANLNIVDIGAEFISFYNLYNGQIISYDSLNFGIYSLLRNIDKDGESFELAESELVSYLEGECIGDNCKAIKEALQLFKEKLRDAILASKAPLKIKQKPVLIVNPNIHPSISKAIFTEIISSLDIKYDALDIEPLNYELLQRKSAEFLLNLEPLGQDALLTNVRKRA